MPRRCTICAHPERDDVNQALVAGGPFRNIAERFGTSATALFRHKADHLPTSLLKARYAQEVAQGDTLLDQVHFLQARALSILGLAEAAGDLRAALAAI